MRCCCQPPDFERPHRAGEHEGEEQDCEAHVHDDECHAGGQQADQGARDRHGKDEFRDEVPEIAGNRAPHASISISIHADDLSRRAPAMTRGGHGNVGGGLPPRGIGNRAA